MMAADGTLAASGRADDILNVIGRYGDRAADWVWRNKAAIAVSAVAAAFVAEPERFLDGALEVVRIGADSVVRPVVEKAAESINWNLVLASACIVLVIIVWFRRRRFLRDRSAGVASTPARAAVSSIRESANVSPALGRRSAVVGDESTK